MNPMRRLSPEEYAKEVAPPPTTCTKGCIVVIETGDDDPHVPEASVLEFKAEMDAEEVDWRVNIHARTPHGWALALGVTATCYREEADRRSTMSMLATFAEAWPEFKQYPAEVNACGTTLNMCTLLEEPEAKRVRA